jgi:hypothetical protein
LHLMFLDQPYRVMTINEFLLFDLASLNTLFKKSKPRISRGFIHI